ncbi:MAG: ABC transporter ATP-binding protein [Tissierellia bacterium]|nr:ABC transporter ATP-binding protein [Tissierellia bacterium]
MKLLDVEHITKIYPGAVEVIAVNDVSFSMEKGDFFSIIGASGSGKSTLLHMIGGVDKPTKGVVKIQDTDITSLKEKDLTIFRRRNIGIIYQFFNLIPNITVEKNILLPLLLDGRKDKSSYFHEIIHTLGIENKIHRYPNELSGGEQQRVAIARSLVTKPAIILADEPTGNLDRQNTDELMALFEMINQRFQATILLITHDEKVALTCEKTFKMVDGHLEKEW